MKCARFVHIRSSKPSWDVQMSFVHLLSGYWYDPFMYNSHCCMIMHHPSYEHLFCFYECLPNVYGSRTKAANLPQDFCAAVSTVTICMVYPWRGAQHRAQLRISTEVSKVKYSVFTSFHELVHRQYQLVQLFVLIYFIFVIYMNMFTYLLHPSVLSEAATSSYGGQRLSKSVVPTLLFFVLVRFQSV